MAHVLKIPQRQAVNLFALCSVNGSAIYTFYIYGLKNVAKGCFETTFLALNSYCVHMVRYCCLTISKCFDETKLHF